MLTAGKTRKVVLCSVSCLRQPQDVACIRVCFRSRFGSSFCLLSEALDLPDMAAVAEKLVCHLCHYKYDLSEGRRHGKKFQCLTCNSAERTVRRNLEASPMSEWSVEETQDFYQKLHAEKAADPTGRLQWKTVRATVISTLTERAMSRYEGQCLVESLPLSVWVSQGWDEKLVLSQPNEYSDEYQCQVYKVPVRRQKWTEVREREEKRILEREQEVSQRRGKKGAQGEADLDVPTATAEKTGKSTEAQEAKKADKERQKMVKENERLAATAAKALGPLSTNEGSLDKVLVKAQKHEDSMPEGSLKCGQDILTKLREWSEKAREAINTQEANKVAVPCLVKALTLPFKAEDVKTLLKQKQEAQKVLQGAMPQKPKRQASQGAGDVKSEPPAKRQRGKQPQAPAA